MMGLNRFSPDNSCIIVQGCVMFGSEADFGAGWGGKHKPVLLLKSCLVIKTLSSTWSSFCSLLSSYISTFLFSTECCWCKRSLSNCLFSLLAFFFFSPCLHLVLPHLFSHVISLPGKLIYLKNNTVFFTPPPAASVLFFIWIGFLT